MGWRTQHPAFYSGMGTCIGFGFGVVCIDLRYPHIGHKSRAYQRHLPPTSHLPAVSFLALAHRPRIPSATKIFRIGANGCL